MTPRARRWHWIGLWLTFTVSRLPAFGQGPPPEQTPAPEAFVPLQLYHDRPEGGLLGEFSPLGNLSAPRQKAESQLDGPLGVQLTGKLSVAPPVRTWDEPLPDTSWTTEEGWRWEVVGPFTFFGQLGANGNAITDQEMSVFGKTGVAWKLPTFLWGEYLLKGGPAVTCTDPLRPIVAERKSELFLELNCKWPLPWQMKLEYLGCAVPALLSTPTDRLNQDLGLALPLGGSGSLKLGAKHNWEYPTAVPLLEQMQVYVGLSLTR